MFIYSFIYLYISVYTYNYIYIYICFCIYIFIYTRYFFCQIIFFCLLVNIRISFWNPFLFVYSSIKSFVFINISYKKIEDVKWKLKKKKSKAAEIEEKVNMSEGPQWNLAENSCCSPFFSLFFFKYKNKRKEMKMMILPFFEIFVFVIFVFGGHCEDYILMKNHIGYVSRNWDEERRRGSSKFKIDYA